MNTIMRIRQKVEGEIFDYQVLMDALAEYRKPRDKITKLLASGMIVRIKKDCTVLERYSERSP